MIKLKIVSSCDSEQSKVGGPQINEQFEVKPQPLEIKNKNIPRWLHLSFSVADHLLCEYFPQPQFFLLQEEEAA
jgi:hypothetical protein